VICSFIQNVFFIGAWVKGGPASPLDSFVVSSTHLKILAAARRIAD
jgi:hypothetical protein